MCIPSITVLHDGRRNEQARRCASDRTPIRPLSAESRGIPGERPPTGIVMARPTSPLRCPVPWEYLEVEKRYFAGGEKEQEREQARKAHELEKICCPMKKEVPRKEYVVKEILVVDSRDRLQRRRRRSSTSSVASRKFREAQRYWERVLRNHKVDYEVRLQIEAELKLERRRKELRQGELRRGRERELDPGNRRNRSRRRERTPLRGGKEYIRPDSWDC